MHIVLAITGASGVIYGLRLCEELLATGWTVTVLISRAGFAVLKTEAGLAWQGSEEDISALLRDRFRASEQSLGYFAEDNLLSPIASGSSAPDAMVICPCTMGTLAGIASGSSRNLLERCADVMLKERRPLVLVPRETPLSEIHLENMLKLVRMGVGMVPPMPAFYHSPRSVEDLVNFVVGKVLEALGIEHGLYRPWGSPEPQ